MNNSSPHIRSGNSELGLLIDFMIAAVPALIWSAIAYGARPIVIVVLSVYGDKETPSCFLSAS